MAVQEDPFFRIVGVSWDDVPGWNGYLINFHWNSTFGSIGQLDIAPPFISGAGQPITKVRMYDEGGGGGLFLFRFRTPDLDEVTGIDFNDATISTSSPAHSIITPVFQIFSPGLVSPVAQTTSPDGRPASLTYAAHFADVGPQVPGRGPDYVFGDYYMQVYIYQFTGGKKAVYWQIWMGSRRATAYAQDLADLILATFSFVVSAHYAA